MLVGHQKKDVVPNFIVDSFRAHERVSAVSFIRQKARNGIKYSYLVESIRVDGRVLQKVLVYLGRHKNVKAAHRYWERQAEMATDAAGRKRAAMMIRKLKLFLK